jgi:hypothetical protein
MKERGKGKLEITGEELGPIWRLLDGRDLG